MLNRWPVTVVVSGFTVMGILAVPTNAQVMQADTTAQPGSPSIARSLERQ